MVRQFVHRRGKLVPRVGQAAAERELQKGKRKKPDDKKGGPPSGSADTADGDESKLKRSKPNPRQRTKLKAAGANDTTSKGAAVSPKKAHKTALETKENIPAQDPSESGTPLKKSKPNPRQRAKMKAEAAAAAAAAATAPPPKAAAAPKKAKVPVQAGAASKKATPATQPAPKKAKVAAQVGSASKVTPVSQPAPTKAAQAGEKASTSGVKRKRSSQSSKAQQEHKSSSQSGKTEETSEQKAETREAALEYLRLWKTQRDQWKFKKVRQVFLLQNAYREETIPKDSFKILVKYMAGLQGKVRDNELQRALKLIEENQAALKALEESKETSPEADSEAIGEESTTAEKEPKLKSALKKKKDQGGAEESPSSDSKTENPEDIAAKAKSIKRVLKRAGKIADCLA